MAPDTLVCERSDIEQFPVNTPHHGVGWSPEGHIATVEAIPEQRRIENRLTLFKSSCQPNTKGFGLRKVITSTFARETLYDFLAAQYWATGEFEVMLSKGLGRHFAHDEKERLFQDAKNISDFLAVVMDRRTQELEKGKQRNPPPNGAPAKSHEDKKRA